MATKQETASAKVEPWWETAQLGDRFGRTEFKNRTRYMVVETWDGNPLVSLMVYDEVDECVRKMPRSYLVLCTPDHVGNMRRAVQKVLEAVNADSDFGLNLLKHLKEPGYADEFPESEAKDIVPNDWRP